MISIKPPKPSNLTVFLYFVVALLGPTAASADDGLRTEILNCAALADDSSKLECFNAIANQLDPAPDSSGDSALETTSEKAVSIESADKSKDQEIKAEAEAQDQIKEMDDSMGGGEFADKAGVKPKQSRGQVTSCKKSADRRWFFIFDNGQVWKQVDNRRRRFRDCNFSVLISEDAFGYKMQIDGGDSTIRINRIR